MEAGSYQNAEVKRLLAKHFVPIHVDAEAEPDVGERYGFWGWPALVFMTPGGDHVHFVRGFMIPDDFVWLLNLLVDRSKKGELKKVDFAIDLARKPVEGPLDTMIASARKALDEFYDKENGGWGRPKMPFHDLVQQALWRGHTSDGVWTERGLTTAKLTERLVDPVWGRGLFRRRVTRLAQSHPRKAHRASGQRHLHLCRGLCGDGRGEMAQTGRWRH